MSLSLFYEKDFGSCNTDFDFGTSDSDFVSCDPSVHIGSMLEHRHHTDFPASSSRPLWGELKDLKTTSAT